MEETKEARQQSASYKLYLLDKSFKDGSNFNAVVEQARNYYHGKQFDENNDDNEIRISHNFINLAVQIKASKICGTEQYITYTADDTDYDCHGLERFDEYNVKKLNEKTKRFQSVINAYVDSTAIYGYWWDKNDMSYRGIYKGGLNGNNLDLLRFAVADKYLENIQDQEWIMYWNDMDIRAVKNMVERSTKKETEEVKNAIEPDNPTGEEGQEYINRGLCTVFTRYFRVEGEVCYICSTEEVDLFDYPHFLNPRVNKRIETKLRKIVDEYRDGDNEEEMNDKVPDFAIDWEDVIEQVKKAEVLNDEEYGEEKEKFYLYPFARYVPFEIINSFYGRSDVGDMIRSQNGYNFSLSMVAKCIENNAYNKIFVKEGALQGQEVTNEPGQVLVDYTRMTNGWGIKMAESQPLPNGVIDYARMLFDQTRTIYSFHDVMDGNVSNQDISGYAIQQMIKQANSSIEQQQQLEWEFEKQKAEIRLMFYKFYVDKAKYTYELEDYEVDNEERARNQLKNAQDIARAKGKELMIGAVDLSKKTKKVQIRDFSGSDIYGINFDIGIEVMQGLADSKLAQGQMWDTLIMNGNIQNLEPEMLEMYLEANPTVTNRTKAILKSIVEKQKRAENYQLKEKLQEAMGYIEKLLQYSKELEAQNGYKANYIDNLTKEFTEKIGVANKMLTAQNKHITDMEKVSEGEAKSRNAKGEAGSHIARGETA